MNCSAGHGAPACQVRAENPHAGQGAFRFLEGETYQVCPRENKRKKGILFSFVIDLENSLFICNFMRTSCQTSTSRTSGQPLPYLLGHCKCLICLRFNWLVPSVTSCTLHVHVWPAVVWMKEFSIPILPNAQTLLSKKYFY